MFELEENPVHGAIIKVIGVGGAGGNAINNMVVSKLEGVEFIAANTDDQALAMNSAHVKIQLGRSVTDGLGAGGKPEVGRSAAVEEQVQIAQALEGADMVFVTAGMGGGTGTGAAPVVAKVAREMGILTVGVVTKPFLFEGMRRRRIAEEGISALKREVDTLVVVPNQRLMLLSEEKLPLIQAFQFADRVLRDAVQGISDLIQVGGYINVDFADVRSVMSGQGLALMGTGRASGDDRALEAANIAISSPLLEDVSIDGAQGVLINITGGLDLAVDEVGEAAELVQEAADDDANIIFGAVFDESMEGEIKVTVIATGFDRAEETATPAEERREKPVATGRRRTLFSPPKAERRQEEVEVPAAARTAEQSSPAIAAASRSERPSELDGGGGDRQAVIARSDDSGTLGSSYGRSGASDAMGDDPLQRELGEFTNGASRAPSFIRGNARSYQDG